MKYEGVAKDLALVPAEELERLGQRNAALELELRRATDRLVSQEMSIAILSETLRDLEWGEHGRCPCCGGIEKDGHGFGCALNVALQDRAREVEPMFKRSEKEEE